MIQVDVFWSFAFGAMFAACAGKALRNEASAFVNKYFVYNVLFLSVIFCPSGIYLLWRFTGWETMFMLDRDMNALLPTIFAATNTTQGVLGFWLAYRCIKVGSPKAAHTLWISSYAIMFAILGFGYRRFLYAGTLEEWRRSIHYPLTDFFGCPVFCALLGMAPFVLSGIFYPIFAWNRPQQFRMTTNEKRGTVLHVLLSFSVAVVVGAVGYLAYVHLIASEEMKEYLKDGPCGYYAPLVGYLGAQSALGALAILPMLFLPSKGYVKKD